MIRIGINGFGRVGRAVVRALYEYHRTNVLQVVAINGSGSAESKAHWLKYDSTFGRFHADIHVHGDELSINGDKILLSSERDPTRLLWDKAQVDIVFECTGQFTEKTAAAVHCQKGVKKVLISAPGTNVDATIVYGVNDDILKPSDLIVSCASCTTNCLAPVAQALQQTVGIEQGFMTTVHAYTNDQLLIDGSHKDLYRARSATQSIIPTKTGAASAMGLVIPALQGKLQGFAVRVPTPNVSAVDFTCNVGRDTTVSEINAILQKAALESKKGILRYNVEPLVSIDFNHDPASAIVDAAQTKVLGRLVKVFAWYDNEWGFSNRMLDVGECMGKLG